MFCSQTSSYSIGLCISQFQLRPAPPPPGLSPGHSHFFLPWMANSRRGLGLLSCQIPLGGDEKRGQMPRPPSKLQHFSLIAQSNSAILSILMCDFIVSINVFLCNALGFSLRLHATTTRTSF